MLNIFYQKFRAWRFILAVLVIQLIACEATVSAESPQSFQQACHNRIVKVKMGLTEKDILALWGPAGEKTNFKLGEKMNEFRVELLNTYDLAKDYELEVRELTWKGVQCNRTLWFHRVDNSWQSFHALIWDKNAQF